MATKAKREVKTDLVTHRTVARRLDIDTETLRDWVAKGEFPEPHSVVAQTWFYRADDIDHYIHTGRWPEGARFKRGDGKGRGAK